MLKATTSVDLSLANNFVFTGKPCVVEEYEDLGIQLINFLGSIVQAGDVFPDGTQVKKDV